MDSRLRTGLWIAGGLGIGALLMGFAKPASSFPIAPGFCFTLWTGDDLATAWIKQRAWILRVQPQIVMMHVNYGGGSGMADVAAQIRAAVPGVRLGLEVATDPAMSDGAQGAVDTAVRAYSAAQIEFVVWNAEQAFKTDKSRGADVAQTILSSCAQQLPGIVQGHSAYAQPTQHESYPWPGWLGGTDDTGTYTLGAAFDLPQEYPFGDAQSAMAPAGAMLTTIAHGNISWGLAEAQGIIRPGVPRGIYAPSMYVAAAEMLQACADSAVTALWPWHGRYDDAGLAAAKAIADRWR